jgi:aminopeptidase O
VKNGQNPEMAYTQVHYLKGYFLLHYLCENVGEDSFFILLRHYIHDLYHGQLVNSLDFLTLYFAKHFSPASSCEHEENVNKICNDWLDTKELHPSVARKYTTLSGPMLDAVELAARVWVNDYGKIRKRAKSSIKKASSINTIQSNAYKLLPEQIVLFLEKLLSSDVMINNEGLSALWIKFQFDKCNADIQHRWCELVVKHRFSDGFPFIKKFLQDHQAMGIYLYGEMALLKHKKLHTLAMDTFNELRSEMDPSTIDNVSQILSG